MFQIAIGEYGKCKKQGKDGTTRQMLDNLESVKQDCAWLEEAFSKYGTISFGPDIDPKDDKENKIRNMFKMTNEPSFQTIATSRTELRKLLEKNKHKKVLVVYVFAGHGMDRGEQVIVLNEFDKREGFYKCWKAENMIRRLAEKFQNSFHLAFYACCREVYDPNRHCGGFTDTEEVSKQVSNDQEDQEEQAQVKNDGTRGGDDAVLLPPIEIQNMI